MKNGDPEEGERVQKILARAGFGSRRACEELVRDQRVAINGTVALLGARLSPGDELRVDGAVISTLPDAITYLLNKPSDVVTTASDPQGRPTVVELVPTSPRVFPVGRLDMDTEGLLLMTNDGEMANRLTHPSFGVEKEYLAHVSGTPGRAALRQLREGVELDDGLTAPAKASSPGQGLLRITIHEGRNRQVRRMCDAVGFPVKRLVRVRIGPIADRTIKPGQWRQLSMSEVIDLQRATA